MPVYITAQERWGPADDRLDLSFIDGGVGIIQLLTLVAEIPSKATSVTENHTVNAEGTHVRTDRRRSIRPLPTRT